MKTCLSMIAMVTVGLAGCSAAEDGVVSGEEAYTQSRTSLERELRSPIPVPTDTPIGKSLESFVSERTRSLTAGTPTERNACTMTRYKNAEGAEEMSYEKCAEKAFLRIGRDETGFPVIVYADHNGDGKVDSFRDQSGPLYAVEDENRDGKVDRLTEAAERVPDLSLADFGGGNWALSEGGQIANRILEDKNRDGRFELESITAKQPAWFVR
ncbi:MAG: hypothetical protein KF819_09360 [Labilithrix sp.]|nr:hypothetical protein [Labilithrix sp.]